MSFQTSIKLLVMDVDGTLTDGKIFMSSDGELIKGFDIKDGYGINNILKEYNIIPVIITGRSSKIVLQRSSELNITEIYQDVSNKLEVLHDVMKKYECTFSEIAYIGDDIPDLECMELCEICASPFDGVEKIKKVADFISSKNGGAGAVREFIDWLVENYF